MLGKAWKQIQSRNQKCDLKQVDTQDEELGLTIEACNAKAKDYLCVYGGEVLTREQAIARTSRTHQKALWYKGDVIDGIDAKSLPVTHAGALANSSKKPNAKLVKIEFDETRDVILVQALSDINGPVTIDYRLHADFVRASPSPITLCVLAACSAWLTPLSEVPISGCQAQPHWTSCNLLGGGHVEQDCTTTDGKVQSRSRGPSCKEEFGGGVRLA